MILLLRFLFFRLQLHKAEALPVFKLTTIHKIAFSSHARWLILIEDCPITKENMDMIAIKIVKGCCFKDFACRVHT